MHAATPHPVQVLATACVALSRKGRGRHNKLRTSLAMTELVRVYAAAPLAWRSLTSAKAMPGARSRV